MNEVYWIRETSNAWKDFPIHKRRKLIWMRWELCRYASNSSYKDNICEDCFWFENFSDRKQERPCKEWEDRLKNAKTPKDAQLVIDTVLGMLLYLEHFYKESD